MKQFVARPRTHLPKMKQPIFLPLVCILFFCGASLSQTNTPQVPLVDHHQHLFSAAKARVVYDPPLPAVTLPAELADLLRAREAAWNNKQTLGGLFVEDVLMLNTKDEDLPTWMRGREQIAEGLTRSFDDPYRITPVAFRIDGTTAYVAGYYTRGIGDAEKHFGHVMLSLRKGVAGRWLIAAETPTFPGPFARDPSTADQLIAQLDEAGVRRAVVLSVAYQWGRSANPPPGAYDRVKAENDYIAREVGKYPQRLVGFCSFNPLKEYALSELERCKNELKLKGLKLHFANSRVDIRKPEHLEKVRAVFRLANRLRMPMVVHMWTSPEYNTEGDQHARVLLEQLLPEAPDVTVQIAHLAGGGDSNHLALKVFADAITAKDRRTRNLYFDVATTVADQSAEHLRQDAQLIRRIGLDRILYGTDTAPPHPPARISWANFKGLMPLTDAEIRKVASNI